MQCCLSHKLLGKTMTWNYCYIIFSLIYWWLPFNIKSSYFSQIMPSHLPLSHDFTPSPSPSSLYPYNAFVAKRVLLFVWRRARLPIRQLLMGENKMSLSKARAHARTCTHAHYLIRFTSYLSNLWDFLKTFGI